MASGKAIIINGKIYYKCGWSPSWKGILKIKNKYPNSRYYFQKIYNPEKRTVSYELYVRKRN